jgi:putative transposase
MARRKYVLADNEIYHVFNRSVGNEELFGNLKDIDRALKLINFYRYHQSIRYSKYKSLNKELKKAYDIQGLRKNPLVEIYAYAIMPNHYHLLLKQLQDKGIQRFVANFQNSLARYYNTKTGRRGSLFINNFKAKRIENDQIILHVSRYIHLNPVTSHIIKESEFINNIMTSFYAYSNEVDTFVDKDMLLSIARSRQKYIKFVFDQVDYQRKLNEIKSVLFD